MENQSGSIHGENPVKINSDKPIEIKIEIPTKAYFMSGIRDFTLQMIRNMTDFTENWCYRFQSIVDELCNNAIEHGSNQDASILIKFIAVPEEYIQIEVQDFGKDSNPIKAQEILAQIKKAQETDVSKLGLRGRGLAYIVSQWTDELEVLDTEGSGHIIRIKKFLGDEKFKTLEPTLDANQIVI